MFSLLAAQVLSWMVHLEPTTGHTPADVREWPALAEEIADAAELWPIGTPRWTASVMVVYAWHESRFRWHPCSTRWDCDHGGSVGVWQTARSWGSPSGALTVALMHESWERCSALPASERLAAYAFGRDCSHRHSLVSLRDAQAERLVRIRLPDSVVAIFRQD